MEYFYFCFLKFDIRALRYISTWNTWAQPIPKKQQPSDDRYAEIRTLLTIPPPNPNSNISILNIGPVHMNVDFNSKVRWNAHVHQNGDSWTKQADSQDHGAHAQETIRSGNLWKIALQQFPGSNLEHSPFAICLSGSPSETCKCHNFKFSCNIRVLNLH